MSVTYSVINVILFGFDLSQVSYIFWSHINLLLRNVMFGDVMLCIVEGM